MKRATELAQGVPHCREGGRAVHADMKSSRGGKGKSGQLKTAKSTPDLIKRREDGFVVAPSQGIPTYNADTDPYCPRAQVRKYNNDRRINAEEAAANGRRTETWIKKTMQSKFDEVPQKFNPSLRTKAQQASASGPESLAEVEILQKVIVRENLLAELQKLLHNQNDVSGCLGEVVELVKAIRYQTVDIVEDIDSWQYTQPAPRPFLYRGVNYLIKIFGDLNFLDVYQDIVENFCFEFTSNPLAYRGGGDIATGIGGNARSTLVDRLSQQYNASGGSFDGIEVVRLRNAERTIQREFDRLDRGRQLFGQQSQQMLLAAASIEAGTMAGDGQSMAIGEAGFGSVAHGNSISSPYQGVTAQYGAGSLENSQDFYRDQSIAIQTNIQTNQAANAARQPGGGKKMIPTTDARRKWRQKFSQRKVKLERIALLTEEANELRAMQTHIEEKINALVEQHRAMVDKRKVSEGRRKEALALDREAAAQHFAVEISVYTADMQDINAKIKDFQRQNYFISIERNRKRKVVAKLKDEVDIEKKRAILEEKLAGKIKEGGILNALKTLNLMQTKQASAAMGAVGVGSLASAGDSLESNSLLDFIQQQADEMTRSPGGEAVPEVKYGGMESSAPLRNIYYQEEEEEDGDIEYIVEEDDYTDMGQGRGTEDGDGEGDDRIGTAEEWEADMNSMGNAESQSLLGLGGAVLEDSVYPPGEDFLQGDTAPLGGNWDGSLQDTAPDDDEEEEDVVMPTGDKMSSLLASAMGEEQEPGGGADLPVGTAFSLAKARREGKMDNTEQFEGGDTQPSSLYNDAFLEAATAEATAGPPPSPRGPASIADQAMTLEDLEPYVRSAYATYCQADFAVTKLMTDSVLKARRRLDLGSSHVTLGTRYLVAEWNRSQCHYDKAQEMYQKVLDLLGEGAGGAVLGRETLQLLTLVGLADTYRHTARYEESESRLRAAQRLASLPASALEAPYFQSLHGLPAADAHSLAASELYASLGALSVARGSYDEAEGYYSEALAARTAALGSVHCRVGSILTHLARVAWLRCRYTEALERSLAGLALKQASLPEGHPSLAASFYWHAAILRSLGRHDEATPLARQCLDMRLGALGEGHASVAQARFAAAELLREAGLPLQAAEGYDEALRLRQRCFPKASPEAQWHPCVVDSILSLAVNAEACGRYLQALPLYTQALGMREEIFAAMGIQRHPEVALVQLHVARMRVVLNQFDGVELLVCTAGRAIRQTLGAAHSLFALFLQTYSALCSQQGKFDVAHELLERSLAIHRAVLAGSSAELTVGGAQHLAHPAYAAALHATAENMLQPGCLSEALARCDAAIEIAQTVRGGPTVLSAPYRFTRAKLLCLLQRPADAEFELRDVLAAIRETAGEASAAHAEVLGEYGECLRLLGPQRIDEADGSLSSGLRGRRVAFGPTHRLVAEAMRSIACLALDRGKADDALSLLRDGALPLFETVLGPEHPETIISSAQVGVMMLIAGGSDAETAPAEALIHSGLDFLSIYEYGRFTPAHPWVQRMGGYRPADDGLERPTAETVEAVLGASFGPKHLELIEEWCS